MSALTPLQSLRRLVDVARLIDADECPDLYNQLQAELTVAGAVLADPAKQAEDFAHFLSYSGLSGEPADVMEKMRRAFEAARPVEVLGSAPNDWQLVPKKITPFMERAARNSDGRSTGKLLESPSMLWTDMLAAAPLPEAGSVAPVLKPFTPLRGNPTLVISNCTHVMHMGNDIYIRLDEAEQVVADALAAIQTSAAQDARDAEILPEKMPPEIREVMWDTIARHNHKNLEYWIEDLYNEIRIAAMALEKK